MKKIKSLYPRPPGVEFYLDLGSAIRLFESAAAGAFAHGTIDIPSILDLVASALTEVAVKSAPKISMVDASALHEVSEFIENLLADLEFRHEQENEKNV